MFPKVGGRKKQSFCYNCKREVTFQFRAKCTVCDDVELCCDCFSAGVKLYPHEPWHGYSVNDCLEYPCFTKDWSFNEELLLLEAIEKCGLGNWKVIMEYMAGTAVSASGSSKMEREVLALAVHATGAHSAKELKELIYNRSAKEIESHYYDMYIKGGYIKVGSGEGGDGVSDPRMAVSAPEVSCRCYLPDQVCFTDVGASAVGRVVPTSELCLSAPTEPNALSASSTTPTSSDLCTSHTCICRLSSDPSRRVFPPTSARPAHPLNTPAMTTDVMRENTSINRDTLLPGYMPLRCDFDFEYDNEAEVLLADMEFASDVAIAAGTSTDDGERHGGKSHANHTGKYSFSSRHEHASETQLKLQVVDIFNQKLTEREARKCFVVQTGLVDIKRQQQLERKAVTGAGADVDGSVVDEKDLIAKLRVFSRFSRQYGPTSANANATGAATATGGSAGEGAASESPVTGTSHAALVDALMRVRKLKRQIEVLGYYRRYHVTSLEDPRLTDLEKRRKAFKEGGFELVAGGESAGAGGMKRSASAASLGNGKASRGTGPSHEPHQLPTPKRGRSSPSPSPSPAIVPCLNPKISAHVAKDPCFSRLSVEEQRLCAAVNVLPSQYIDLQRAFCK